MYSADTANPSDIAEASQLQIGDIMVYEEDFEPRIRSAILGTVMYKWLDMLYYRQIVGDTGGSDLKFLGYLIVEPAPCPRSRYLF